MNIQLFPFCLFFFFCPELHESLVKIVSVSSHFPNFWLSLQNFPKSILHLTIELKRRGSTQRHSDWSERDTKPGLTNYSSSRCVRPMTVSLASWALNLPSLWTTAGQRKEAHHIKTRFQSITEAKSLETHHYHLTAELQSQFSSTCTSCEKYQGGCSCVWFLGMETKNHCSFTTSKQWVLDVNFHFLFALHLLLIYCVQFVV